MVAAQPVGVIELSLVKTKVNAPVGSVDTIVPGEPNALQEPAGQVVVLVPATNPDEISGENVVGPLYIINPS